MMAVTVSLVVLFTLCRGLTASTYKDNMMRFESKSLNHKDKNLYRDCHEVRHYGGYSESGIYTLHPNKSYSTQLHCEHARDASYTVIQRRNTGDVDFNKGWTDYLNYFGGSVGDYWTGLYTILALTGPPGTKNILKVDMQTWDGRNATIRYNKFNIQDQISFTLQVGEFQSDEITVDDLAYSNGQSFYTPDIADKNGCATVMKAGWWYNDCTHMLPNGHYYVGGKYSPNGGFYDGVFYEGWTGFNYSLKSITMSVARG